MSLFGAVTALTAGAATLNPATGYQWFFVQNNATTVLTLTFKDGSNNVLGQVTLNGASSSGGGGGYVDSVDFPMFLDCGATGSVVLAGTGTGAFSSGASKTLPSIIYNIESPTPRTGR